MSASSSPAIFSNCSISPQATICFPILIISRVTQQRKQKLFFIFGVISSTLGLCFHLEQFTTYCHIMLSIFFPCRAAPHTVPSFLASSSFLLICIVSCNQACNQQLLFSPYWSWHHVPGHDRLIRYPECFPNCPRLLSLTEWKEFGNRDNIECIQPPLLKFQSKPWESVCL